MEDASIVDAVKAGDDAAYTFLVEKYKTLVFSIIRKVITEIVLAEEIAQDVFVIAFKKLDRLKQSDKFKPWLCRIALNTALNQHQKKKPVHISFEHWNENIDEAIVNETLEAMENTHRSETVKRALEVLQPDDRILLELFYLEEMSVAEISEITSISVASIKVKLHRIRKKLYAIIAKGNQ
ncbi:MAG: RNA polymerase sigma factor [Bacteroidota bacterium]